MASPKRDQGVEVSKIIQNARNVYSKSKKRHQTLFHKIVIGGTTGVISHVIAALKSSTDRNDLELLHWLMGDDQNHVEVKSRGHTSIAILKGIILVPLWIITTPIFYFVHAICNALLNSSFSFEQTSISEFYHLEFPLAFAVLSGNNQMVELFLSYGISIEQTDDRGNNIFHYLADLSRKNLPLAQSCYTILMRLLPKGKICEMILHSHNTDNYNPIEYAVHFGNLQFAIKMTEETMQERVLFANKDDIAISTDEDGNYTSPSSMDKPDESNKTHSGASCSSIELDTNTTQWSEKRLDVTMYEAFNRNGQSAFLLNLLIFRSPLNMSESDLEFLKKSSCVQRWMSQKVKQWVGLGIAVCLLEIAISLLLTLGVLQSVQGDFNLTPNRDKFVNTHTQIFLGLWKDAVPTDAYYNLSQSFFDTYSDIEEALSSGQNQMDYMELKSLITRLPGYSSFDTSDMESLYEAYCVTGSLYVAVGDLLSIDNCTRQAADNLMMTSCREDDVKYSYYFVDTDLNDQIYEYVIATSFNIQIYTSKLSIFRNTLRIELTKGNAYFMLLFMAAYSALYLFLDIVCRVRGLLMQLKQNVSLYFLFATPLEGSYIKGQANCFSLFAYLLIVFYYWSSLSTFYGPLVNAEVTLKDEILLYDRTTADYVPINLTMVCFFVGMFVFRIILHLNFMKMWPWIGKFIITTFMLTVDLVHFTVVYVLIVFFFASLFHFVSRSDDCPDHRDEQNYFVSDSLFSTFALTFGHADFAFQNDAVKLAYLFYVVMSIILLLNLIIALMGTTASLITTKPWLVYLMQQARVVECIGLESWIYRLFGCLSVKLHSLKHHGFEVEKDDKAQGGLRIFVDVFELDQTKK